MNSLKPSSKACRLLLAAGALATSAGPAAAALKHQYTFNNGNAFDSVGGQNAQVVDKTGIAKYIYGALDLSANDGANSNQDFAQANTIGAYVDLPNGILSSVVQAGTPGAVTLEIWATPQENRPWARLLDFGTSNEGEDFSTGAGDTSYVLIAPTQLINGQASASIHNGGGPENFAHSGAPLAVNVRSHLVLTIDHNDSSQGNNGTFKLYVNNGAAIAAPIPDGVFFDSIANDNNWLGRSQYGDPLFDGLIDEFRIYDTALTQTQVTASFNVGPVASPVPVLVVNRQTGVITLANQSSTPLQVTGYSIASAAGSLNPAEWNSVDGTNVFDPNGTWTASTTTNLSIAEALNGPGDGGALGANASFSLGAAWSRTMIHDLTFTYTLQNGTAQVGQVLYTEAARVRSDLNGNGAVDAADWAQFLPNSFKTFVDDPDAVSYLKGDLNNDGRNDLADFKIFKADYIAANGATAFAALTAIPEPATFVLGGLAMTSIVSLRRRLNRRA